jgi:hypothetical protein
MAPPAVSPDPGCSVWKPGEFWFQLASPQQRFYFTRQAVIYRCHPEAGTIWRYEYPADRVENLQQLTPPGGGLPEALTQWLTGCSMAYQASASERAALVVLSLTLAGRGEEIQLIRQVHVSNLP